jgi:ferredoxin-NADP reductase/DMSO/TMAO reductase YedYZ heme-binding membrane subunit
MTALRLLTALWLGALAAAGLASIGAPWPLPLDAGLLAHVAGLLAGYLAAVMLVLMSRAPVLERRVGSDVLARWHSRGGRLFLGLALVHAGAAVQAWAVTRQQDLLTSLVTVLGLPGLVEATLGTALFVAVAALSIRAARRAVSYETWHGIHLLTYVAVALSFVHELAGPDLAGQPVVQVLWTLLYAYALALVLRYRLLAPLESTWRHRLRVEAVVPEAEGVVSLILRGRHLDELGAEAGQFFRWRFLTPATWRTAHPFSLSAPPRGDHLRITVKALGDGSRLVHAVRPGTLVLAEGPSGAMTAHRRTRPSVLLIAGGVGITPMRALFETLDIGGGRLTLLYRASGPRDVVFRAELEHIARRRGAEIVWMVGPSSSPALRMTGENLRRLVPDVADRDVYLCASPGLSAAVRTALRDAGLPRQRLHEEVFAF